MSAVLSSPEFSFELCASKRINIKTPVRGVLDDILLDYGQTTGVDAVLTHKHFGACVVNPYSAWALNEFAKP